VVIERVYLDLDCVLADLLPGLAELFGRQYSPETWPAGEFDVAKVFDLEPADFWAYVGAQGGHCSGRSCRRPNTTTISSSWPCCLAIVSRLW